MNPSALHPGANPEIREINYAPEALQEISFHVVAGFDQLAPDGAEAWGVLFGDYADGVVKVTAMRAGSWIPPNGAGPDGAVLDGILQLAGEEPSLAGTRPVGWYLSHTRDSLVLRARDRDIFDRHFSAPWQITLVIRPGRIRSLRAATMARHPGVADPVVLHEFVMQREPGEPPVVAPRRRLPGAISPKPERKSRRWLWTAAITAACLVVAGAVLALFYAQSTAHSGVGMKAYERDGVLQIAWDTSARAVSRADRGKLDVSSGADSISRPLNEEEIHRGLYSVLRKSADVTAHLYLYRGGELIAQESAYYAGRPIVKEPVAEPPKPAAPPPELENLKQENALLQADLKAERKRADELESRVRVLQKIVQRAR